MFHYPFISVNRAIADISWGSSTCVFFTPLWVWEGSLPHHPWYVSTNPNSSPLLVSFGNFAYTVGIICLCPNSLLTANATGTFAKNKSFQCIDKAASEIVLAGADNELKSFLN